MNAATRVLVAALALSVGAAIVMAALRNIQGATVAAGIAGTLGGILAPSPAGNDGDG